MKNIQPLKSINSRKCLTKCYPKNQPYLHPISLRIIPIPNMDSCAIYPVHSRDTEISKYGDMIWFDKCNQSDNEYYEIPDELDSMLLRFTFNSRDFLTSIYELYSFDDVIRWSLENDDLPTNTIKRVHNCAWKIHGDNSDNLSTIVIDYYYDLFKDNWLENYMIHIMEKYSLELGLNEEESNGNINNILIKKYFTYNFFWNVIKSYIEKYKSEWEKINSHFDNIRNFTYDKILEKLNIAK